MKSFFTFWVFFVPVCLSAQSQVWQVPVVHHDLQLELPLATVLDSIVIDVPLEGNVYLRFDGNCTASVGDRIILAASNTNDWDTDDGNTRVNVRDNLHLIQCFNHTRIYPVSPGQHTMYAVAQNWADTDGNGIASIDGQFTVTYVPNEDEVLRLSGERVINNVFEWKDSVRVLGRINIEAPEAGQLLVNVDGWSYLHNNDSAIVTLALDSVWPAQAEIVEIYMSDEHWFTDFLHRQLFDVGPGMHTVYLLGRRIAGNFDIIDNFISGTLAAEFIPYDPLGSLLASDDKSDVDIFPGSPQLISEVELNVQEKGRILVGYTGILNAGTEEVVKVSVVQEGPADSLLSERIVQADLMLDPHTKFSQGGFLNVEPGLYRFAVYADYDQNGIGEVNVNGLLTARFIKEPVISAVDHESGNEDRITWYPNPTAGLIQAEASVTTNDHTYVLSVHNAMGQLMLQNSGVSSSGFSADLSNLPEGLYQVSIRQRDKVETQRVLKVSSLK